MTPRLDHEQSVLLCDKLDTTKNLVTFLKLPANETFALLLLLLLPGRLTSFNSEDSSERII